MGLIGYYLALNYQTKNNDYRFDLNHYDISNINYSDLEINGEKYNKSNVRRPFYLYLGDEEGITVSYKKISNIKIPYDISLENGDTFTYTDIETNKNFKIKLENNEKSGENIIRQLKYNKIKKLADISRGYINIHNVMYDASFDCKLNDNSYNYSYYSELINKKHLYRFDNYNDEYGTVYDNSYISVNDVYNNYYCYGLVFKNAYYRIKTINFNENSDLSINNVYYDIENKLLKKKVLIEVWVDIYENIDIVREIKENRYIGTCNFRKEINKEDNISNLWEYCYDNLKILLKKYLNDCVNNFKLFEYLDISSNMINM